MAFSTSYQWTPELALLGPLRTPMFCTSGLGTTATAAALAHESRCIIVHGNAGKLKVKFADKATVVTIASVAANQIYPFCVTHVYSVTGSATKIWAYY